MTDRAEGQMVFVTLAETGQQRSGAQLLIDSLRWFGGRLSDCPVWLFEPRPRAGARTRDDGPEVTVLPLTIPESLERYWFAGKVCA